MNVTACPTVDGFGDEVNVVAVASFVLQAALPMSV
jgi:predicted small secreted protein